jgi:type VI secretion system protein ImpB
MPRESVHEKLSRVRPPRVHVTYDVETGDAIETKELPFVMGVLADLSGQPTEELPRLKDRRFVEIGPDNFDDVLESFKPHLNLTVDNKLTDEANPSQLKFGLDFKKLEDFEPARVASQVEPLKKLMDLRDKLSDLRGALQGNEKLDTALMEAIKNTETRDRLKKELEADKGSSNE